MPPIILYYYASYEDNNERKKAELLEVHDLLESVRADLYFLITDKHSNFYRTLTKSVKAKDRKINYARLFKNSYDETFDGYDDFLKDLSSKISVEDEMRNLHYQLKSVGFTGKSLKLKLTLLSEWWEQLKQSMEGQLLDWGVDKTRRLAKKFLAHLNSILGSLSKVFPLLEPVLEYKETIETANEVIDEMYLT